MGPGWSWGWTWSRTRSTGTCPTPPTSSTAPSREPSCLSRWLDLLSYFVPGLLTRQYLFLALCPDHIVSDLWPWHHGQIAVVETGTLVNGSMAWVKVGIFVFPLKKFSPNLSHHQPTQKFPHSPVFRWSSGQQMLPLTTSWQRFAWSLFTTTSTGLCGWLSS